MNKLTRQELDDQLLDYLYDELEPSERSAFERALPEHPEIAAEVEAHRATRKAYAVLPREVAPPGLLANVLREAEAEAKRRGAAAERVPWWEKVRRVLFQPTFAMAAVVLLVAGVSYVSMKTERLPGMEPARDSQHIPPVAMTAPAIKAEREAGEDSRGAAGQATLQQPVVAPAVAPTTPTPELARFESAADPKLDSVADGKGDVAKKEAPRAAVVAPEPTKAKDQPRPPAPKLAAEVGSSEGAKQGMGGGDRAGLLDGDGLADTGGEADDFGRRPLNTGNVPARSPTEEWVAPAPLEPVPDQERKKSDTTVDDATTFDKVVEAPKREQPTKPTDSPAKAPVTKDAAPAGPPPAEAERKSEEVQVTRTTDNERRDSSPKPATLTPPAPNAETLWATYRKQDTAGAYADALASIEALAKVEGESTRVKEARTALKNKLATTKTTTTDKVPPDPPVQAPK